MRFSIITITYNAEKHLQKTLESVAAQSFTDFEHIIWDGGSTDRTIEIAKKFPHVKIYQGKDEGISDAMNRGAAVACGEFLLHLHADDYLTQNDTLLIVDTHLRQHPEIKWLYGQIEIIDDNGEKKREGPFTPFNLKKLKRYNTIPHPACFYSKELFAQVGGFSTDLRYAMDYDLWRKFAKITLPLALPKIFSSFREHSGSTSTTQPVKVADEAYLVRKKHATNIWQQWRSYRTWKQRRKKIESTV
jgi:glycosyltransferase involved in cell wall biosynthesis